MKNRILILAISVLSFNAIAQKSDSLKKDYEIKTLFGSGQTTHGGFGALMVNYTELGNKEALLVGGRGGWIMNHGFSLGVGGYGLTNYISYDNPNSSGKYQFQMGYGGLYTEVTIGSKWPIHLSFPVLIGAGGAIYTTNSDTTDFWKDDTVNESDAFFVVEPGANLELNITKFFRIGFNVNYRWVEGLKLSQTKNSDLEGLSGGVTLKFGKF